ncbi:MAG: DNA gyrase inhibitor YacG [Thermodesulfobacteriaceae bacterium]|nr:DNA gyrase inhibitor YacG [Thermodesulfobacteriaceae bacterium]MCX8041925.1 DNA gyrase inhibitor YacG [Thermodesulfobacteriaceae bacterium]
MGSKLKCPKCKREVKWKNNPYKPFCSKVCKLADLYGWLEEEYRIKVIEEIEDKKEPKVFGTKD